MPLSNKDLLYLLRMLEAIGKIISYTKGFNNANDFLFANEQKEFNASLLLIMQIGEQVNKIDESTKLTSPEIEWAKVKSLRNRVAHDYINVDALIIFATIKNDLPILQSQISICINKQVAAGNFDKMELEISKGSLFYQHINFELLNI